MNEDSARQLAIEVIMNNNIALIGTTNRKKRPSIRAMTKINNDSLYCFYFSTKLDSLKVEEMKNDKQGCVYFFDTNKVIGVLLEGTFNVIENVDDAISSVYQVIDYDLASMCSIKFTTNKVSVYYNYETWSFEI